MSRYSYGWTPADEAASIASANARDAHREQQSLAQRVRALEQQVAQLEAAVRNMHMESEPDVSPTTSEDSSLT